MENNVRKDKYIQSSRIAANILIFSILLCLISFRLAKIQAIADFRYSLHELLYLPVNIGLYLIPVEAVCMLYFFTRWIIYVKKNRSGFTKINLLHNFSAILCLTVYLTYFIYVSYGATTSGYFEKIQKGGHDNKYYIIADNRRLSCTENEYSLIDENKGYMLSYEWNKLHPEKGKIIYIKEAQ